MSISSIFGQSTGASSSVAALLQQLESSASTTDTSGTSATGSSSSDSSSMSQLGQLYSQLQQLSQSNPTEFKQVATAISDRLQQASAQQTGTSSSALSTLAAKFDQAAQTGSMAPLQATSSHHGGGHHHGGGAGISALLNAASTTTQAASGAYSSTSQSTSPLSELESIIQGVLSSAAQTGATSS